jgi:HPr kinase/phosphorylase
MNSSAAENDRDQTAATPGTYIHATALAIGEVGILIRGPSGAGKSRLALELLADASSRGLFTQLVGDDRVAVETRAGRLIARGHPAIAGEIESRGEGIVKVAAEPATVIRLVLDVGREAGVPARLPQPDSRGSVNGVSLPQLRLNGPAEAQARLVISHLLRLRNG